MVAVVVSFVASTAVAQYVESKSAKQTEDIVGNAMPSVQLLALVRGDLRNIDRAVSRRAWTAGAGTASDIQENRRNIDAALASYMALPFFPGEADMFSPIPGLLRQLDREVAGVDSGLDDAAVAACQRTIDVLDRALQRIVTYDASQGQRLGLAIAHSRNESRSLVWLLDAASVLLAIGAMALALRQRRRAIRMVEEDNAATEQRLTDLTRQVDELGHFAARVAHDIRGPLQAAVLSLDIVRESSAGSTTTLRAVERGTGALQRMSVLVEGLLEFARAGGMPAVGATAHVHAVVKELVEGVGADARTRQIEVTGAAPVDCHVAVSTGVLTSIVANLVGNAIRHMGDAVERRVEVSAREAGPYWRIEVRDTGPGIPPGQEQRVFEPHVQLGAGSGGLGLGLATVQRLVRAHGGAVGVISPPGRGCLFWVELPRARPAEQS